MSFDQAALEALPGSATFIDELRAKALAEFEGLPIPPQTTEEWRYTDLSDFAFDFAPFTAGGTAATLDEVPAEIQAAAGAIGDRDGMLFQHNSQVMVAHLDPALADQGVLFGDLDAMAQAHPQLVQPALGSQVPVGRTKFTALHHAFRTGGTFVYVPKGVVVERPLQSLLYLDADGAAVFPHTLIVVEEGAEITFIDRYVSPDLRAFSSAAVEIVAGAGSQVRYACIQDWGEGVTHLGVQRAALARDAQFHTVNLGFGASLARSETESILEGPGAHAEQLGVFFADGDQVFDHRTEQDHVAPNCTSELLYKGALRDTSRAVFSGWVHVRPGAQKTDAMQTSRNIVLSDKAKADAIPNLEIEANDVKCGHAASVGPVSPEELFYLESRGIPAKEAERLIVAGFFQEVLDRITLEEVREAATAAIADELERA